MNEMSGKRWGLACGVVLAVALLATVPTTGDLGLTWDEPAYRYSQVVSSQWWEQLSKARSTEDVQDLLDADALLYYWPYARHGINFHPPLAGQLNLLTYTLFGGVLKDIPARRLASVFEYCLTITLLFGFLARCYGFWVGVTAAGALLCIPRVYGHGHIAGTDTPGLFLWALAAVAFWKGLQEPNASGWRVLVGVLVGLSFLTKMAAVVVLLPLVGWLVLGHLPRTFRRGGQADWIDGTVTTLALLAPLAVAFLEIQRLSGLLPEPKVTDLFRHRPSSSLPGWILFVPLLLWMLRRLLAWSFPTSKLWGVSRPALEIWTAILAFAPAVALIGCPPWWRETLPRLAHYAMLNSDREGALPDIRIYYWGETYLFSLPWHNAWVLIGITVPLAILIAAVIGVGYVLWKLPHDRLPFFFLVNFATLPILRMLPTPAHDGVRLFLPSFFFLAALAGWGTVWLADGLAVLVRKVPANGVRGGLSVLVLGWSAWQLARIHPFELSYYNEAIGGPRGAWKAGFELSYWYDAYNAETLRELNEVLPEGVALVAPNEYSNVPTFLELQSLGALRGDIVLGDPPDESFPFMWLLTHDSKANGFSRLLFAMDPWYERRPRQLDGLRVASVADPVAVSRAWALNLLIDAPSRRTASTPAPLPPWVRTVSPWLGRFWGEGVPLIPRPGINESILEWANSDPAGLLAAAKTIAEGRTLPDNPEALRLWRTLTRADRPSTERRAFEHAVAILLRDRPEALTEAAEILVQRPEAVRQVVTTPGYTDPDTIGGFLDQDFPFK